MSASFHLISKVVKATTGINNLSRWSINGCCATVDVEMEAAKLKIHGSRCRGEATYWQTLDVWMK